MGILSLFATPKVKPEKQRVSHGFYNWPQNASIVVRNMIKELSTSMAKQMLVANYRNLMTLYAFKILPL